MLIANRALQAAIEVFKESQKEKVAQHAAAATDTAAATDAAPSNTVSKVSRAVSYDKYAIRYQ